MARKPKKTGKPLQLEDDERPKEKVPTMEEHIQQLHGESPVGEANGMPSKEWLKANFKTKSAAVRYLVSDQCPGGPFKVKDIAAHLGMLYQHVRNIKVNPLKRGPNESWLPKEKPPTQEKSNDNKTDK